MIDIKAMPLYTYLAKHLNNPKEAYAVTERAHQIMSPNPWPDQSGAVNMVFLNNALCGALERSNLNLVLVSRSRLFAGMPSWMGSPTELFDEMVSLRVGLHTLHSAVQNKYLGKRNLRCRCCGTHVDDEVSKMLKAQYGSQLFAGSCAIANRFSVMVCYLTVVTLKDLAAVKKVEPLVLTYERAAVLGELQHKPGTFLVQVR